MKRLILSIVCTYMCTLCGPCVHSVSAQTTESYLRSTKHEERIEHRAERLAAYEQQVDSLVLSHNFEFNPQTVQVQPAGPLRMFANANFTVIVWRGSLDVCLPYYTGMVPPYRYVVMNTGSPYLKNYLTVQTHEGWQVSFNTTFEDGIDYTFTFDIYSHGGATLTITNSWYSPVQYTGTISKIY